ncbi:MAG: hypothetical protein ABJB12_07965 [Pseudomonadota bacterium]
MASATAPLNQPSSSAELKAHQMRLDEADRARVVAYRNALLAGRRATKEAKYDAAAKAFTAALAARPDDPRAYAERGYAAFLAKDYVAAQGDLAQAAERANDRVLRAQTFFNLGLVREALAVDATSAFALSNYLHPSAAAQKKLAGKETCPVEISRTPVLEKNFGDWLAFFSAHPFDYTGTKPTSSEAARKVVCEPTGGCPGSGPWVVTAGSTKAYLVRKSSAGLAATSVATATGTGMGFCPLSIGGEILQRTSGSVVVRANGGWGTERMMCVSSGGTDYHDCGEEDQGAGDPETQNWVRGCDWHPYTQYSVVDSATGTLTLSVTVYDDMTTGLKDSERIRVSANEQGIALSGPGCSMTLPLPSAGVP